MNLILTMTLSGSLLYLITIVAEKVYKKFFSTNFLCFMFKAALILHFLPLACVKIFFPSSPDMLQISGKVPAIIFTPCEAYATNPFKVQFVILFVWIINALIIFGLCLKHHRNTQRIFYQASDLCTNIDVLNKITFYKKKLNIKRKLVVYSTKANIPPITFGIIHPVIIILETLDENFYDSVLHHEMWHIRHMDSFFMFLRLLAISIYWFNPIIFKIGLAVEKCCDLACDESVTKRLDWNQKKEYGNTLIKLSTYDYDIIKGSFLSYTKSKKFFKERIDVIMTTPKKCTCQTVLVSLLALAICTFPALAYTPPIIVKGDDNLLPANNSTTVEMFVPMDSCGEFTQSSTPILYSSQFIDSNGNIYPVYESISNKACTHNFEPGEYNTHTKHSDGSCTVKNYSAQRCSKCGYVKRQNLLSTTKYPVCPH